MDRDASGDISRDEFCQGIISLMYDKQPLSMLELHHAIFLMKAKLAKCEPLIAETKSMASRQAERAMEVDREQKELLRHGQQASTTIASVLETVHELFCKVSEVAEAQATSEERLQRCQEDLMAIQRQMALDGKDVNPNLMKSIWEVATPSEVKAKAKSAGPAEKAAEASKEKRANRLSSSSKSSAASGPKKAPTAKDGA